MTVEGPYSSRSVHRRRVMRAAAILAVVSIAAAVLWRSADLGYRLDVGWASLRDVGGPTSTLSPLDAGVPPNVRLAVAGDVGTGDESERRTASAVAALEEQQDFDALLLLGDNVYPNGDPGLIEATVFDPFAEVLDGPTQLIPVLGNHDVREGNAEEHARTIGMADLWYQVTIGEVTVVALDSNQPDNPAQLEWLDNTLASIDTEWVVVTMHHPLYSAGVHGSSLDVRAAFGPLFERYGVELVLSGHDHDYQRSTKINGVTYIVSGAAAKTRPAGRADFTYVSYSTLHFLDIVVWPDRLQVRAINQDQRLFDSVDIVPGQR